MDNKLSELSKPIGVAFKSDIELMQSGRMIHGQMTVWRGCAENQVTEGVYSQEYVSVLLAHIAELERILDGVTPVMIAGGWTAKGISDYAKSLETKLATPVRLPALLHPESDAVNGMIFANGRNEAIAECSVAIRQAGLLSEASPMPVAGDDA